MVKWPGICVCILSLLITNIAHTTMIEDLARNAEILSAKISPQGDYLGVLRISDDKRSLVIFTFPGMKFSSQLSYPDRDEVGDFWWVNDERIVASVYQQSARLEAARSTGELFGMNADGSRKMYLFGYRAGVNRRPGRIRQKIKTEYASAFIMDRLSDHPEKVLIRIQKWSSGFSSHVEAAWLDIYTGKQSKKVLAATPNAQLIADGNGEIRFSFHTDDDQNFVIHTRKPDDDQWEEFSKTPYGDAQTIPIALLEDDRVLVSHSPDEGPYGVYTMDPENGSFEVVFRHEFVDAEIEEDSFGIPFGVYTTPGRIEFTALDENHSWSRAVQALQRVFPDGSVQITSSTEDDSLMVVHLRQDTKTPEYFLFDTRKNNLNSLFDSRPWVDDSKLAPMKPITVTARDGLELHGYLTLPVGSDGQNEPLVIVPHGGPHGPRDSWGYQWFEGFIPAGGYAMLQVNYRGSGGYGPKFERIGHGEWANKMQDDLTDSVRWAISEGIADPDRICIFGWSYGGFAAVMSIAKEPDLYKCAVSGAGVYDQNIQYKEADFATRTRWGKRYIDKVIGPTEKDRRLASPTTFVESIKTPLLLIHGEEDERVPIEHARALQRAMEDAGKPRPRLIELENEEHTPRNEKNKKKMFRETLAFFDKHIGDQR